MTTPEIADIAQKLREGRPVEPVTVRTFLWWFGAQRRGYNIVRDIRLELAELGIETYPDFEARWVDAPISFQLVRSSERFPDSDNVPPGPGDEPIAEASALTWISRDPTHRISKLAAANQKIISVTPDSTIQEVVTTLLSRDFSQVPVMTNERTVKGVVSWKTIGSYLSLGKPLKSARDAMEDHHEVRSSQSIFEAIPLIQSFDYVLVRAEDQKISGIVTASDLSSQFYVLSEPFLLLSEIENLIRNMIGEKFTVQEISSCRDPSDTRTIESVHSLTFGEYLRLLQVTDNWSRLGLPLDRALFCKDLDVIRIIRNDITHFDPDGITPEDREKLRDFKSFLQRIERLRAPASE